jgi:hypothetical protein
MGIADLFNNAEKREENAIRQINDNESLIIAFINEYHSSPDFNRGNMLDIRDLLLCVKGDLLKSYLHQLDTKDKDLKYFFKGGYFRDNVLHSVQTIYNLCRQIDAGNKRTVKKKSVYQLETAEAAQESLNKIYEFADKFNNQNQRRR